MYRCAYVTVFLGLMSLKFNYVCVFNTYNVIVVAHLEGMMHILKKYRALNVGPNQRTLKVLF